MCAVPTGAAMWLPVWFRLEKMRSFGVYDSSREFSLSDKKTSQQSFAESQWFLQSALSKLTVTELCAAYRKPLFPLPTDVAS